MTKVTADKKTLTTRNTPQKAKAIKFKLPNYIGETSDLYGFRLNNGKPPEHKPEDLCKPFGRW